jgi:hypothetical protein
MELRIVIFLGFVAVTVITNAALIFFISRAFAGLNNKVDTTVSEFEKNGEVKEWLDSLQTASAQAVLVTQASKEQIASLEPVIANAQESYKRSLAQIDSKLEHVAGQINTNAQKARDAVAKPAFSVMAYAAGVVKFLENLKSGGE